MAKPVIKKIQPFDAAKDYEVVLAWSGSRAYANRIVIYDSETNSLVFDDTVSSFALKHTIPAHTLANGKRYVIQAQTYDAEDTASPWSDKVLFCTFQTPDFYFQNIPENGKITNASFQASIYYHSSDWEDISTYIFYLYDSSRKQLSASSALNDSFDISYTYRGLENNAAYYIRCAGVTVNGMELDTGYQEITVKYENPDAYSRIYSTALPSQGCVQVATNLIVIQYNGTDSFEYPDGMIDLRDKTLYYDEGFLVEDDFTLLIRGIHLWQNAELLKMNGGGRGLTLSSHIYGEEKLRFRLLVPNGVSSYLLYSDEQVFENEDMVTVAIRRRHHLYQLKVFVEPGFTPEGNAWYGAQRPAPALVGTYDSWLNTDEVTYVVNKDSYTAFLDEAEPLNILLHDLWIGGD